MSDYKTKLVNEFSRLWELDQQPPVNYLCQVMPPLKHLMQDLVDEILVKKAFHADAWARSFLLRVVKDRQPNLKNVVGAVRNQEAVWITQHIDSQSIDRLKTLIRKPETNFALLTAYLQASAWYATRKLCLKLGLIDNLDSCQKAFTAAQQATYVPAKLLQAYDFTYQIQTYAERSLYLKARDGLVKGDPEAKLRKRSSHGRLKDIGKEKFAEVLRLAGRSELQIACDRLLWSCYGEIYQPAKPDRSGSPLPDPTIEQWQAIADLFNQRQAKSLPRESQIAAIDAHTARSILIDIFLKAINDYLEKNPVPPPPLSLDTPFDSSETDSSVAWGDLLPANAPTPEQVFERTEMRATIEQAFQALPESKQAALILMEMGCTTTEAGVLCKISQSNVSRILSQPLTQELIKLLHEQYRHQPGLPDREQMSQRLKTFDLSENIALHCQSLLDKILTNFWQTQNLVHQPLETQVTSLSTALQQWLTNDLHVKQLDACPTVAPKITTFVEFWLHHIL